MTSLCLFCHAPEGSQGCDNCPPVGSDDPPRRRRRKFPRLGPVPRWAAGGTYTQQRRAAAGLHPMGLPLAPGSAETCGTCAHLDRRRLARRVVFKCGISRQTSGRATDTRKGWPACTGHQVDARHTAPRVTDVDQAQELEP